MSSSMTTASKMMEIPVRKNKFSLPLLAAWLVLAISPVLLTAQTDSSETRQFRIAPQPLDSALLEFSEQARLQLVVASESIEGIDSDGFTGEGTAEHVLLALLEDTNLQFQNVGATVTITNGRVEEGDGSYKSQPEPDEPENQQPETPGDESMRTVQDGLQGEQEDGDKEKTSRPLDLGVQTVTGSRLSRNPGQIPTQTLILSNEDLRNTGAPTLEQALRQLPQNINGTTEFGGARLYSFSDKSGRLLGSSNINGSSTINLRGLGESATLVLINGKRAGDSGMMGGFTDISEFPVSIIERVEIQLDGASAVYGSDAIGGVVNIILKEDYDLVRVSLRRTARTGGGLTEDNGSVTAGTSWSTGNATFSWDAYKASHHNLGASNLLGHGISLYGYPGSVRGRRGTPLKPREISPSLTQAAVDAGVIGPDETVDRVLIPTGQDGTNLALDDFLASADTFRTDEGTDREISITPGSNRHTFRVAANQQVFDRLEMSGGITYATRKTASKSGPAVENVTLDVAAENPYNPFGRDVRVDLNLADVFGTQEVDGDRESWTMDLDFSGTVSEKWNWQLRSKWASRESTGETTNFVDFGAIEDLVDDTRTNPSNALNVFGNSFLTDGNNASVLAGTEFRYPLQRSGTTNSMLSSELVLRGDLFSMPAGAVRAVLGSEWRKSSVDVEYGNTYSRVITSAAPVGLDAVVNGFSEKGTRTLRAGFAEVFVPIISEANALPGIHDLNLSLSGRHERANGSSGAGIEVNSHYQSNVWSLGLVYRPSEAVKLRVNKSTSYRAPDIAYALLSPVVSPGLVLDFRTGGFGLTFTENISGGNPNLEPEESTSTTAGIEISPTFLKGLSLGIDYHDTRFENRIATLNIFGSIVLIDLNYDTFYFQYTLDEDGRIKTFDSRPINIAYIDTRGLDYRFDYRFDIGANSLRLFANAAVTDEYLEDINTFDSEEAMEIVGVRMPKYRFSSGVSWERAGWYLALNARTSSGVRYSYAAAVGLEPPDNNIVRISVKTDPPTTVDFRGTVDVSETWSSSPGFLRGLRLAFGVNNIFGSYMKTQLDPRPHDGHQGIPRNTESARGKRYYLEISKEF